MLTWKQHCLNTKHMICARKTILKKLRGNTWGVRSHNLSVFALAPCFSVAEYACLEWDRSVHTKHVDIELNEVCRAVTGRLRPTKINKTYELAAPNIRREVAVEMERTRQIENSQHPMYDQIPMEWRIKFRKKIFWKTTHRE